MPIKSRIRTIPDHPKPGIQFRDITTLLQDPVGLRITVERIGDRFVHLPGEFHILAVSANGKRLDGFANHLAQSERSNVGGQLPRLDLGKVEDFVDDRQQ